MDRAFAEQSRQPRSLPSRSPVKPALARKRPIRPRAGRFPILSSHVAVRNTGQVSLYRLYHATHHEFSLQDFSTYHFPQSQVCFKELSIPYRQRWPHKFEVIQVWGSGLLFTHTPGPLPTFLLVQNDSLSLRVLVGKVLHSKDGCPMKNGGHDGVRGGTRLKSLGLD